MKFFENCTLGYGFFFIQYLLLEFKGKKRGEITLQSNVDNAI